MTKPKFSKKEIRNHLQAALTREIDKIEGSESSKKTKRVIRKASKNLALKVKMDLRKKQKKIAKAGKVSRKGKARRDVMQAGDHVENGHA